MHKRYMQHISQPLLTIGFGVFAIHNHMDQIALNVTYTRRIVQRSAHLDRRQELHIVDIGHNWNAAFQKLIHTNPR